MNLLDNIICCWTKDIKSSLSIETPDCLNPISHVYRFEDGRLHVRCFVHALPSFRGYTRWNIDCPEAEDLLREYVAQDIHES